MRPCDRQIVHTVYIDMPTVLTISQADARPMYLQIVEQIRHRVAVGDWQPGQEIPSIRALAIDLQVSVITVKRAYLELEHAGVIVQRQGRGTFVAEDASLGDSLQGTGARRAPDGRGRDRPRCSASTPTTSPRACEKLNATARRKGHEHTRDRNERRPQGLQVLRARRRVAAPRARPDHGLRRAERRRQDDDDPALMAMIQQDAGEIRVLGHTMPKEQAAREVGHRLRLRRHEPVRRRDARLAHGLREVDLCRLGRGLREDAAEALQSAPRATRQRACRTASGPRRRCCSCSRAGRGCSCSTSRRRASTPSRVTRRSRSSWRS